MRTITAIWTTTLLVFSCVAFAQQAWQAKTPIIASLDNALNQVFKTIHPSFISQKTYHIFPEGGWFTHHWINITEIPDGKKLIPKVAMIMQNSRQFPELKFTPVATKNCIGRLRGTFTYYQPTFNNPSQAYTAFILIEGGTGEFAKKPYAILDISIASYPPSRGEPCQK